MDKVVCYFCKRTQEEYNKYLSDAIGANSVAETEKSANMENHIQNELSNSKPFVLTNQFSKLRLNIDNHTFDVYECPICHSFNQAHADAISSLKSRVDDHCERFEKLVSELNDFISTMSRRVKNIDQQMNDNADKRINDIWEINRRIDGVDSKIEKYNSEICDALDALHSYG